MSVLSRPMTFLKYGDSASVLLPEPQPTSTAVSYGVDNCEAERDAKKLVQIASKVRFSLGLSQGQGQLVPSL